MKSTRLKYWIPRSSGFWKSQQIRLREVGIAYMFLPRSAGVAKRQKFVDFKGVVWPACGAIPKL